MSKEHHITNHASENGHGTVGSYIVGFILSLVFTIIPYHLVVNKVMSGTALTLTILGIAVVQMAIQMFFFLHLGRGPKPLYNVIFFFATAGIIVLTIGASLFIMSNLYHNMSSQEVTTRIAQEEGIAQIGGEQTGACQSNKNSYIVTMQNDDVIPLLVQAQRCDTLTFVNKDDKKREIVFGSYPDHVSYGGIFDVHVDSNRSETITLNESGEFTFYDRLDPEISGRFYVAP